MNADRVAQELGGVRQELGDLQGTVRALDATVARFMETWQRQDTSAMEGRRAMYERVDSLTDRVAGTETTLEHVQSDLEEIKSNIAMNISPTVTAYRMAMAHRAGMFFAGKMFWAGILAAATVVGFLIHEVFQSLKSGWHWPFH